MVSKRTANPPNTQQYETLETVLYNSEKILSILQEHLVIKKDEKAKEDAAAAEIAEKKDEITETIDEITEKKDEITETIDEITEKIDDISDEQQNEIDEKKEEVADEIPQDMKDKITENFNENDLDVKLLMETQKKDFFLKWSKDIYEKRSNTKFTNELDAFKASLKNKNVNGFTVLPSNHREYLEIKWTIYYTDNNNNPKKIDGVSYGNNVRRINNEYISNYHSMVINDETFLFFDPLGHKSKPNVHVFLNPNNGVINEMVPEITLKNGKKFKKKNRFSYKRKFFRKLFWNFKRCR